MTFRIGSQELERGVRTCRGSRSDEEGSVRILGVSSTTTRSGEAVQYRTTYERLFRRLTYLHRKPIRIIHILEELWTLMWMSRGFADSEHKKKQAPETYERLLLASLLLL